jgi:hypothetical protein
MVVETFSGLKAHESDNGAVTLCGQEVHLIHEPIIRDVPVARLVNGQLTATEERVDLVPPEVDCKRCLASLGW